MTGSRDCWREGGLALPEVEPQSPHLPGFVPPGSLASPDHQPVDRLEPHFGPRRVPSFLSEFPPIRGQLGTSLSPLQLNLTGAQPVGQPQHKLYFRPISILVPSFLSQYPPIRSCLHMSLLPDVSPDAKPLDQHPPTFLSFAQSLDSIIGTTGALVTSV